MSNIQAKLDELVEYLAAESGIRTTRNPAKVIAPCIFVDVPAVTGVTMGKTIIEVPVWLIAPGQADLISFNWLADHVEQFVRICKTTTADPQPYGDTAPAYRATLQMTI